MPTPKILLTTPINQSAILKATITHFKLVDFKYDWDRPCMEKREYIQLWLAGTYYDGEHWLEPDFPGLEYTFERGTLSEPDLNALEALIEAGGTFSLMGGTIVKFLVDTDRILDTVVAG